MRRGTTTDEELELAKLRGIVGNIELHTRRRDELVVDLAARGVPRPLIAEAAGVTRQYTYKLAPIQPDHEEVAS